MAPFCEKFASATPSGFPHAASGVAFAAGSPAVSWGTSRAGVQSGLPEPPIRASQADAPSAFARGLGPELARVLAVSWRRAPAGAAPGFAEAVTLRNDRPGFLCDGAGGRWPSGRLHDAKALDLLDHRQVRPALHVVQDHEAPRSPAISRLMRSKVLSWSQTLPVHWRAEHRRRRGCGRRCCAGSRRSRPRSRAARAPSRRSRTAGRPCGRRRAGDAGRAGGRRRRLPRGSGDARARRRRRGAGRRG